MHTNPLEYAQQIAYSSKEVLMFSNKMARKFKDSPGYFVECGCAAGAQVIAMAYGAPNKAIIAFDSFDGIPLPSNRDDQMPGIMMLSKTEQKMLPDPGQQVLESSGATVVPLKDFMDHLKNSGIDWKMVLPIKGWFEQSVPLFLKNLGKAEFPIALLRLDGDLYNSTWVCLQNLFPKVIQGGCVIIDDWSLPGCKWACIEYFGLIGYEPDYKFLDGTAYFFK